MGRGFLLSEPPDVDEETSRHQEKDHHHEAHHHAHERSGVGVGGGDRRDIVGWVIFPPSHVFRWRGGLPVRPVREVTLTRF